MPKKLAPRDRRGAILKRGHLVRVIGIPDLGGMRPSARRESLPVFRYLVGKYKVIRGFDKLGNAELFFRIRKGRNAGLHTVWIEPYLLQRRLRRGV